MWLPRKEWLTDFARHPLVTENGGGKIRLVPAPEKSWYATLPRADELFGDFWGAVQLIH